MEVDPETKGNGNSYTTEFRQYDPRLGRWLSLDPLMASFPWQSPYCAFDNNPVYFTDPYGLSATNKDGVGEGDGKTKYSSGNSRGGEFCSTCGESNQSTSQFDLKMVQTILKHSNLQSQFTTNGGRGVVYQTQRKSWNERIRFVSGRVNGSADFTLYSRKRRYFHGETINFWDTNPDRSTSRSRFTNRGGAYMLIQNDDGETIFDSRTDGNSFTPSQTRKYRVVVKSDGTGAGNFWRVNSRIIKYRLQRMYWLFGFIPIRMNSKIEYLQNTTHPLPDIDIDRNDWEWETLFRDDRKRRKAEHKRFKKSNKVEKGKYGED
jgi:RHS repeat-associated protein